jgi:DNA processing protein
MPEHYRHWLVLAHAHVRVSELLALLDLFGDTAAVVGQPLARLREAGLSEEKCDAIASPNEGAIDKALAWLEVEGHHLVTWDDDDYPAMFREIPGPPLLLYVNGDASLLQLPALAIIGSRNPTQGGARNAREFARHLASRGFVIVSGMAQGIDAEAHRGALDAVGKTIAFLGTGIDRVYPAVNRQLAHEIASRGALVTEYPLGAAPERWHFPERNRLISGLTLGTVVVEAARRSGSLITARLAGEQGREIFALPGSIHNPLSRGCHELIRQGAKLVETAGDILSELGPLVGHMQAVAEQPAEAMAATPDPDDDYDELRRVLSYDPMSIDELEKQSGLTIDQLSSMLLILELHGEVESLSGGRYVKKEPLQA